MTKKFETSKHYLIAEKNLDQKYCFSVTNGPITHHNKKPISFLQLSGFETHLMSVSEVRILITTLFGNSGSHWICGAMRHSFR